MFHFVSNPRVSNVWYLLYLFIFISSLIFIVIIFSIGFGFSVLDICFGSPFGWIVDMGLGNDLDVY